MNRYVVFAYGVLSYCIGLGGLTFFVFYVGGWWFMPVHIDSRAATHTYAGWFLNALVVAIFGLQHSIMARPEFKRNWNKVVSQPVERSTYVLISGLMMCFICFALQPVPGALWDFHGTTLVPILNIMQISGWLLGVTTTFLINHFELFGLQQTFCYMMNRAEPTASFTERYFYRFVRHPLQLGFLVGLWCTPCMSLTHFSLSLYLTIYIVVGLHLEEKTLAEQLGNDYREYQQRVRMLIPIPRRARSETLTDG